MVALNIIGLLAAIVVMAILCYKGVSIFLATLVASAIAILTNGVSIPDGMTMYATGIAGFVQSYIFYFFVGTSFGAVMQDTGCAERLGSWILEKVGTKGVVPAVIIVGGLMTTAGISGYVVTFTVFPIAVVMWRGAKLPRHILPAVSSAGATIGAGFLPYSPLMNNVIPTEYLGTTIASGAFYGIVAAILAFVLSLLYYNRLIKKKFGDPSLRTDVEVDAEYAIVADVVGKAGEKRDLPPMKNAAIPVLASVACLIILTNLKLFTSMQTVLVSIFLAIVLTYLLNWKRIKKPGDTIKRGLSSATTTCMVTAAVLGFGGIVSKTPAYSALVQMVLGLNTSPYLTASISTNLLAGVMASAPGGIRMAMQTFGEYFVASGADLGAIHKIAVIAGLGLNTLPHSGTVINSLDFQKVSFKDGFWPIFVTSGLVPSVCSLFLVVLAMILAPV